MTRVPPPAYDTALRGDPARLRARFADASTTPYWLDGPAHDPLPALTGPTDADLLVVGGGYAGLWTALLAKDADPGRDVVVLEARTAGWAASGRNGGFIEATLTHGAENGARHARDEAAMLDELGAEHFDAFVADLDRFGIDAGLELDGLLTVATEPHQVEWLSSMAGADAEFLDQGAVRRLVDSPVYRAGLRETRHAGLVDPGRLVRGLVEACLARGVRIFEHTPATGLVARGSAAVEVRTPAGRVRARQVALATNGFPSLLARTRLLTMPVYDYVLMTEPLGADRLASIGWEGRYGITDSSRQFHYYRKTVDDRILWGGYDAVYHRGGRIRAEHDQSPDTFLRLADHFATTFPQLDDVVFTPRWGGMIDMSSRLFAFHGLAARGRVAYSAGFTGLGVVATRFAAEVMLDLLDGRDTSRTRSATLRRLPLPIPPEPVRFPAVQVIRNRIAASDRSGGRDGILLRLADAIGFSFDS